MKVRILAVEDVSDDYKNLVSILRAIPKNHLLDFGITDLLFERAESYEEAEEFFNGAKTNSTPYHILILDLKLPERKKSTDDKTDYGFKTLNVARRLAAVRQIIIYTNYPEGVNIQKALREGANDFVGKPSERGERDHELQTQFMCCWQRVLTEESARLLDLRVKDLIPYAEAGLAHRFTACFSAFVETVDYTAHDIERYASERFGLERERDSQDYLFRLLNKQATELRAAQDNWAALKADLSSGEETPKAETLETLLNSIEENLMPCLLVKNTPLERLFYDGGQTRVLSFQDDVRVVIQEIISGMLSDLPDFGAEHRIKINLRRVESNQTAELEFSEDFSDNPARLISRADAQAINGGLTIGPDHEPMRFGRTWGLSVVQHIALRGGGRLIVMPQLSEGNKVTYIVPLAQ
jgi:CheY-like chemotaxis protein